MMVWVKTVMMMIMIVGEDSNDDDNDFKYDGEL